MSKSDPNPQSYVSLLDSKDEVIKKFKRAVTDSNNVIKVLDDNYGVTNLINIYCGFTNKTVQEAEKEFEGMGYGDFKIAVGEVCADGLEKIQSRYKEIVSDKAYLDKILTEGAQAANRIAQKTISKVYRKVGFYQPDLKK